MMEGTAFRTCAVQSKLKLRPFFWNKIPNNLVSNSLWVDASDRTKSINLELLEDMFHVEEKEKNPNSVQAKATAKTLLDPKRAQNLGIFLSGFKMTAKQIDEKLSQFRGEEALPMDQVIALKRFLPSAEEAEMYKNYKEDPSTLVPEDQFMMKLCEIKDLEKRLDLLLVVMEFPTQYEDLAPNVDNLLQACQQLYYSKNFLLVLEYVLSIGNILNSGSNRGGAYGFRLQSLPKLADIRGNNKKNTLLKFLILQLENSNPDALNFTGELKSVTKAAACK
ncbi:Formin-like protein 18 [Acropora cervicornis]|uniref:Formin-like protein 18 n=1 Tax=Acropora cervicornis TaxID=6130 RepID=A0AAD9URJ3_ACRCE|nr:Formin-like protein 18 [Acropora cervicornis]